MKLLTLLLLSLPLLAQAADSAQNLWTFNTYYENDLFAGSDKGYTSGIRFSMVSPDVSSYEKDPSIPGWLRTVNDQLHFFYKLKNKEKLTRNFVITVGQSIYTPDTRGAKQLLVNQRPYAGFLYTGMAYNTRSDDQLDTVGIRLGVVGPVSLGQDAQDFIHHLRGLKKWQGWDHQLKNEPGLQMLYEHKQRLFSQPVVKNLSHDLIDHAGVSLGNVATYINMGAEYRLGWQLPDDFGTSSVRPGGDNSAPGRKDPRIWQAGFSGLHAFISCDARAVAHDIFLDGNTFKESHSVKKEPFVADVSAGIAFTAGSWKTSIAHVFRTREYEKQHHPQGYGSLSVSYSW